MATECAEEIREPLGVAGSRIGKLGKGSGRLYERMIVFSFSNKERVVV